MNLHGGYYGSPLGAAAAGGNKEIIRLILDSGADINHHLGLSGSRLWIAANGGRAYNSTSTMKLLLGRGARACGGVLNFAIIQHELAKVKLLLESGMDADTPIYSIFEDSAGNKHMPMYAGSLYTLVDNVPRESLAASALHRSHVEIGRVLLVAGADVNATGYSGDSVLTKACELGNPELVQLLIDHGVDLHYRRKGMSTLDVSHDHEETTLVQLLEHAIDHPQKSVLTAPPTSKTKPATVSFPNLPKVIPLLGNFDESDVKLCLESEGLASTFFEKLSDADEEIIES